MTAITHTWLVAYDISDNRRRTCLHKLLRGYGRPLQKSVFLCHLDSKKAARLQDDLAAFRDKPSDHLACMIVADTGTLPSPSPLWIME
jgi:CRISPR-associated protein Cas2